MTGQEVQGTPYQLDAKYLSGSATRKIVLIDDDDLMPLALQRHLRGTDWMLATYAAPEAALTTIAALPAPHIIFVDYRMPRMNGDEFLLALGPKWGAGFCRKYLCSVDPPPPEAHARAARAGASVLRKDVLLTRPSLLSLLSSDTQAIA